MGHNLTIGIADDVDIMHPIAHACVNNQMKMCVLVRILTASLAHGAASSGTCVAEFADLPGAAIRSTSPVQLRPTTMPAFRPWMTGS